MEPLEMLFLVLIDKKPESATYRIVKFVVFAGAGSAIEKIPYAPAKSIINVVKGFSDTYISPAIEDSWNKFV